MNRVIAIVKVMIEGEEQRVEKPIENLLPGHLAYILDEVFTFALRRGPGKLIGIECIYFPYDGGTPYFKALWEGQEELHESYWPHAPHLIGVSVMDLWRFAYRARHSNFAGTSPFGMRIELTNASNRQVGCYLPSEFLASQEESAPT